jgi:phosphatidylserine/phosphatidylglycerophosphate/cardiolipin synthase-like enzyme/DNA-binding transcriptional ArsR family regulator
MKTLGIPVALFEVECEIASGRPFAMVERTVLRSIADGNDEYERLVEDLALHPRIVAEALTALFEAGIIEFRHGSGAFAVTPIGDSALADAEFIPSTLRLSRRPYRIVVERITGLSELGANVTYERTDELRDRGVSIVPPSDFDPTPGRSTVRRLISRQLQAGEWVRSVGRPKATFTYNSSLQVDVRDGRLERLRSAEWTRALTLALREKGFELAEPASARPAIVWTAIESSKVRTIWGARDHAVFLERVLEDSQRYVFIHSAFMTGARMSQLVEPITRALHRGIDVLVLRGLAEREKVDAEGITILRKLAYDQRTARGRFYFEPYPTGSHAKLLIRDGVEVCVGSFNWLSTRPDSGRRELSLAITSAGLVSEVCDVAADLFRDIGVAWPAQVLRLATRPGPSSTQQGEISVRLVMDGENRDHLFDYLDESRNRVVVTSDKVTSKDDPLLRDKIRHSAQLLSGQSQLVLLYSSIDGERAPVLDGVADSGATVICEEQNHTKALVSDDRRALVTSFNLLSFGGHSSKRSAAFEIGIEIQTNGPAPELFRTLFEPFYRWNRLESASNP